MRSSAEISDPLVESAQAGGAILAALSPQQRWPSAKSSLYMATTAKICLGRCQPDFSVSLRQWRGSNRFLKGSGSPIRIPVIGWSRSVPVAVRIAHVDKLKRIHVGPESAATNRDRPCLGRAGREPGHRDRCRRPLLVRYPYRFFSRAGKLTGSILGASSTPSRSSFGKALALDATFFGVGRRA